MPKNTDGKRSRPNYLFHQYKTSIPFIFRPGLKPPSHSGEYFIYILLGLSIMGRLAAAQNAPKAIQQTYDEKQPQRNSTDISVGVNSTAPVETVQSQTGIVIEDANIRIVIKNGIFKSEIGNDHPVSHSYSTSTATEPVTIKRNQRLLRLITNRLNQHFLHGLVILNKPETNYQVYFQPGGGQFAPAGQKKYKKFFQEHPQNEKVSIMRNEIYQMVEKGLSELIMAIPRHMVIKLYGANLKFQFNLCAYIEENTPAKGLLHEQAKMKAEKEAINFLLTLKNIQLTHAYSKLNKVVNCKEMSLLTVWEMIEEFFHPTNFAKNKMVFEVFKLEEAEHLYVAVNRNQGTESSLADYKTWGDQTIIADAWSVGNREDAVFSLAEVYQQPENYRYQFLKMTSKMLCRIQFPQNLKENVSAEFYQWFQKTFAEILTSRPELNYSSGLKRK
jgi:hypothetical protein